MLRTLRKYRSQFLIVGGVMLMVAFGLQGSLNSMQPDPSKRVIGKFGTEKVRARDLGLAEREFEALSTFSPMLTRGILGVTDGMHWMLLTRKSAQAGLIGGPRDGEDWIPELARELARLGVIDRFGEMAPYILSNPESFKQIVENVSQQLDQSRLRAMERTRLSPDQFDHALASARGVLRMYGQFQQAPRSSDRRISFEAAERLDSAVVDMIVIPADAIAAQMPEPTPEQRLANFEQYRAIRSGTGELGIGYLQPSRVKIEYLAISRDAIAAGVTLDPVEVNKRWRTDRVTFPGEFAAERVRVQDAIRNEQVDRLVGETDRFVRAELLRTLQGVRIEGGYRVLTDDWGTRRPKLADVAVRATETAKASGVVIPTPAVVSLTDQWLTADKLAALEGIGSASIRAGVRTVPFAQAALSVRELRSGPGFDPSTPELGIQLYVPAVDTPALGVDGSRYFFMIMDARPESAPDTIEEVETAVNTNLKRLAAFEALKLEEAGYAARAAVEGLDAVAASINDQNPASAEGAATTRVEVTRRASVTRDQMSGAPQQIDIKEVRDAIRAAALKLDPTKPATETPIEDRTVSASAPIAASIVVAQIVQHQPLTIEMLRAVGEQAARSIEDTEMSTAIRAAGMAGNPFTRERLAKQLGFIADPKAAKEFGFLSLTATGPETMVIPAVK